MKKFASIAILLALFITTASVVEAGPVRRVLCVGKAVTGKVLHIRPGRAAKKITEGVLARRPKLLPRRRVR